MSEEEVAVFLHLLSMETKQLDIRLEEMEEAIEQAKVRLTEAQELHKEIIKCKDGAKAFLDEILRNIKIK